MSLSFRGVESRLGDKLCVREIIRAKEKAVVNQLLDVWFGLKHLNIWEKGEMIDDEAVRGRPQ